MSARPTPLIRRARLWLAARLIRAAMALNPGREMSAAEFISTTH